MNSISGIVENDAFITGLYGALPKFECVNIHQINLNWDGPRANIIFDLNDFPDNPPRKWMGFNTVQLEITAFPLLEVGVGRYSSGNICNINIEKKDNIFFLRITGDSEVNIVASSVCVNKVSAYLNLPDGMR